MHSVRKPSWQQATALVSLSTCGAMTGIAFAHGTLADMTSPASMPVHLVDFKKASTPATTSESALRSAIVKSAEYYLRLAQGMTPAQMEALIWQNDSTDGGDHGESCAAFASLTLEAGAQAVGQQSWVTGGTSYPWPVHSWVDARVDPNPDSPGIISILQDAQASHRWHPLGDGYMPQPGDWVLFAGHVEVVTKYAGGVLYTIGGDSLPNLSVNAHQYPDPLSSQGVAGFVNNGQLLSSVTQTSGTAGGGPASAPASQAQAAQAQAAQGQEAPGQTPPGQAAIPGMIAPGSSLGISSQTQESAPAQASGGPPSGTLSAAATIPGAQPVSGNLTSYSSAPPSQRYARSQLAPAQAQDPGGVGTPDQQAFITEVAPGAVAAQREYGVPAAVTIAQAIDESGWGQSQLATQDNNLFGIKGSGPAGSIMLPTQEFENGEWVSITAPFRVYDSVAQSITDHAVLLATSSAYQQAMADRQSPDAFANDLTGVYATDPTYGASLISIMRMYNLYRFDAGTQAEPATAAHSGSAQGTPTGQPASGQAASGQGSPRQSSGGRGQAGQNGSGQGTSGQASTGQGLAARSRSGQGSAGQGSTGAGSAGPGSAGQNGSGQGSAGQRPAGQGTGATAGSQAVTGQGSTGQGSTGQGSAGPGSAGQNGSGQGSAGQSPAGQGTGATAGSRAVTGQGQGSGTAGPGGASIPGLLDAYFSTQAGATARAEVSAPHAVPAAPESVLQSGPRNARVSTRRYTSAMPMAVTTAFITTARASLVRARPLYQDVGSASGVRWELLAACDWMQCKAEPRQSPVHGEKLGTKNPDGTVYRTKSEALAQCAHDLIELADAVYAIDLTARIYLSLGELANVFAAFRWGGLLRAHRISAMEFPYSVAGLTAQHMKMRWPDIREPHAPDKPGSRFRMSFGAVPAVLCLDYPATA